MRDYGTISTSIWRSEKFRGLDSDSDRVLYFYIHTCQHANSIGCFVLPVGYITTDLQWSNSEVLDGINALCKAGLIRYTYGIDTLYIVDFLAHDPLKNPKHGAGALKIAKSLPDSEEKVCVLNDIAKSDYVDSESVQAFLDTVSIPYAYQNQNQNQISKTISPKFEKSPKADPPNPPNPPDLTLEEFENFWRSWPKDCGEVGNKKRALAQWKKLKPDSDLITLMRSKIDQQASHKRECRARKEFTPNLQHAERWIRDRGWENELPEEQHGPHEQELIY